MLGAWLVVAGGMARVAQGKGVALERGGERDQWC